MIVLFFVCCFAGSKASFAQEPTRINSGVLDLRKIDLSDITLYLQGDVHFHWKELKFPHDSTVFSDPHSFFSDFPDVWNKRVIDDEELGANGYGTYAFKVLLNPANVGQELGFYVQDMYSSYRLFVNGQEIASNGTVAETAEAYVPYWLPLDVHYTSTSDTLEIILQVANFDHSKGGISDAILFGSTEKVTSEFQSDLVLDYALSASLFICGLFFLGLFFFGRDSSTLLYFSLFCLLFSYRMLGSVDYGLHYIFPELTWYLSIRIEYFNMFAIGFVFVQYTRHLYPEETSKLIINGFIWVSAALLVAVLVSPISVFTQFPIAFVIIILLFIPYSLWVYVRAAMNKRPGAWFSLTSLVFMFLTYTLDAMDFFDLGPRQNLLFFLGMIFFFFMQSLVLTYRFAFSYKQALSSAEEASSAKSDFLSVMSHEIRTPLNAVVGMSNLLEVKGEQKENVSTLKHAAQNLLVLVNNILDYTKIDAGKVEFETIEVDIRELVRKLMLIHQPEAGRYDLDLQFTVDEQVPAYIICDPTRLTQVLSNLLNNGLKFTHHGHVALSIGRLDENDDQASLRFEVSDSGIGIPPDKQSLIFDAFTQASKSVTRNYGGTGLGLPIIHKLLKMQGTALHLESEQGKGSRFWFDQTFAKGDGSQQELRRKNAKKPNNQIAGKRILLVEDNPVNVVVARKFLERWKVAVSVAENGQEALALEDEFDLVLMDIQMPDIDGYTLTKMLRVKGMKIPILAFTASALNDARQMIHDAGMDDYIVKPFDPDELYQKLVKHLN